MIRRSAFYFGIAVTGALWCGTAHALSPGDKDALRTLSDQAANEYDAGQYTSALDKFQRAYSIARIPRLAVWLARANAKLGHLVLASELYREAMSLQPNDLWKGKLQQDAQKEAQAELDQLQLRVPTLNILVEGAPAAEATVTIDDVPIPNALLGVERAVDPGTHELVGKRGGETTRESVTLAERGKKTVTLRFHGVPGAATTTAATGVPGATRIAPPPTTTTSAATSAPSTVDPLALSQPARASNAEGPTASTERTLGWIGLGAGAAGLAVGTVAGILVASKYGDLSSDCSAARLCDPKYESDLSRYRTLKTVSTVGFIAGGALAVTGVTLLLTHPRRVASPTVGLWMTPSTAGVSGEF